MLRTRHSVDAGVEGEEDCGDPEVGRVRRGLALVHHCGRVVLGIVLVTLAPSLTGFTSSGYGLPASYQSTQAQAIAMRDFPAVASASGIIEVNATNGSALTAPDLQKIDALSTALNDDHIGSVRSVTTSPLFLAKNQKMQLIQVAMNGQPGEDGPNAAVTDYAQIPTPS